MTSTGTRYTPPTPAQAARRCPRPIAEQQAITQREHRSVRVPGGQVHGGDHRRPRHHRDRPAPAQHQQGRADQQQQVAEGVQRDPFALVPRGEARADHLDQRDHRRQPHRQARPGGAHPRRAPRLGRLGRLGRLWWPARRRLRGL
ncbi:hypothetical protein ACFV1W_25625 [Kitasatospora sp. NPDC059648]|uniref:hypothetical protein n=1 Tax=Kitasatospora sp. NPDC059648 TaxID=3346894 RepID=UPI00367D61B7